MSCTTREGFYLYFLLVEMLHPITSVLICINTVSFLVIISSFLITEAVVSRETPLFFPEDVHQPTATLTEPT